MTRANSKLILANTLNRMDVLPVDPRYQYTGRAWYRRSFTPPEGIGSRHARIESTVSWVTNKMATPAEIPRARVLPEWLLLPDKPVPRTPLSGGLRFADRADARAPLPAIDR